MPCIRDADTLDFQGFWAAYEELIRKVRSNKLSPDDFAGTTVTLTNPGTIGTVQSVPRLMPGQGVIVGVGRLDYPTAFKGADPEALAELGVSKVMTITSTYDHRIIQGAESGLFLKHVHELLLGDGRLLRGGLPLARRALRGGPVAARRQPGRTTSSRCSRSRSTCRRSSTCTGCAATSSPTSIRWRGRSRTCTPSSTRPPTASPSGTSTASSSPTASPARSAMPLGDILDVLRDAYCRTIGVEYMHIQEPEEKGWIQEQVEGVDPTVEPEEQRHILDRLNAAEAFERFLGTKYVGQKRFGIEGAESAIPLLDAILEQAAADGLDSAVLGMAHRGRLNVLANIVGKSLRPAVQGVRGLRRPRLHPGLGRREVPPRPDRASSSPAWATSITVELAANPSHLEAVDPVVEGMVRAKQDCINDPEAFSVLPLLLHGDAAFAGQGVVAETLNLSSIKGYRVGGTMHLVINNQLGFTTPPDAARSSEYCTDVAKMVQAPIFHVNGDDPEACVRVARLAFAYRQRFHKDVVIDMVCYRRHGHNEGDDPSYTQPLMYKRIDARRSVRKLYTEALVKRGDISIEEAEEALDDFQAKLQTRARGDPVARADRDHRAPPPAPADRRAAPRRDRRRPRDDRRALRAPRRHARRLHGPPEAAQAVPDPRPDVRRGRGRLGAGRVARLRVAAPRGHRHPARRARTPGGARSRSATRCWSTTRRGAECAPLAHLDPDQAKFWIYDSLLSEYAALGFEYGYSVVAKDSLVAWEAQFGDFVNGAQIVIDQFIAAAEDKWGQTSGLVLLLPARLRGPGARALVGPHRAVPHAVRRGQPAGLQRDDLGAVLPPAAPPDAARGAQAARRLHAQVAAAGQVGPLADRRAHVRLVRGGARRRRSPTTRATIERHRRLLRQGQPRRHGPTRRREPARSRSCGSSSCTRSPEADRRAAGDVRQRRRRWCGSRRSPTTWAPARSSASGCGRWCPSKIEYREVSRVGSGSPATGSHTIHVQEQDDILNRTFEGLG